MAAWDFPLTKAEAVQRTLLRCQQLRGLQKQLRRLHHESNAAAEALRQEHLIVCEERARLTEQRDLALAQQDVVIETAADEKSPESRSPRGSTPQHWRFLPVSDQDEAHSPPDPDQPAAPSHFLAVGGLSKAEAHVIQELLGRILPKKLVLQRCASTLDMEVDSKGRALLCEWLLAMSEEKSGPAEEVHERELDDFSAHLQVLLPRLRPGGFVMRGSLEALSEAGARALSMAPGPVELIADGLNDEGAAHLLEIFSKAPLSNLRKLTVRNCGRTLGQKGGEALSKVLATCAGAGSAAPTDPNEAEPGRRAQAREREVEPAFEWQQETLYNGVASFCALLPWMQMPVNLGTELNAIGGGGASRLVEALQRSKAAGIALQHVEFPISNLDDDGVQALAKLLPWMSDESLDQQTLDFSNSTSVLSQGGSKALTASLREMTKKPKVDFGVLRKLSDDQAQRLALMLPHLSLDRLHLADCLTLTEEGAQAFRPEGAPPICVHVEGLSHGEVEPLATILTQLPKLELSIDESVAMNTVAVKALTAALGANASVLSISYLVSERTEASAKLEEFANKRQIEWIGPTMSCSAWLQECLGRRTAAPGSPAQQQQSCWWHPVWCKRDRAQSGFDKTTEPVLPVHAASMAGG